MVRYQPVFHFKVILAIIMVYFINASMADYCLWCDPNLSQKFMSCVADREPMLQNNVARMKEIINSIIASSQVMTKSSPPTKMEYVNGLWIGKICELMRMQPTFNNPANVYMMKQSLIDVMVGCYVGTVGERPEIFAASILKHFNLQLGEFKTPSNSEILNFAPFQTQKQPSANSAAFSAQNFNYQTSNFQAPAQQAISSQPYYNNIQSTPVVFNQNSASVITSTNSYPYGTVPSGQQPVTSNGIGQPNYQLYNFDAPQQQPIFQANQKINQPPWNQQPHDNLQFPEQNPGPQPIISQINANTNEVSQTNLNEIPYKPVPIQQQPVPPNNVFIQREQNNQPFYLSNKPNIGQGNAFQDINQNTPINNVLNSGFQQNYSPWDTATNNYPNKDLSGRNLNQDATNPQQYNQIPNGRQNRNMNQQKVISNNDDEISKAMKFAETIFETLSKSKLFMTFFHDYTSKKSAANIAYNITLNALNNCGYNDVAKEIANETSFSITQNKKERSTATYAEAISKALMVQFDKKELIEINPNVQARHIAKAILNSLIKLISKFSIKPFKNTKTSATGITNDKKAKNSNPSSNIPQSNTKKNPNFPISNSYSYSNYDSQTIQRPVQNKQDGYDDYSLTTWMPSQQSNNYDDYKPYNDFDYLDSSTAQDKYYGDSPTPIKQDSFNDSTVPTIPDYSTDIVQATKQNSFSGYNNNDGNYKYSYKNQDFGNYPYDYQNPISKAGQSSTQQKQQLSEQLTSDDQKSSENFDKKTQVTSAVASSSSDGKPNRPRKKIRKGYRKRKGQYQARSRSNAGPINSQRDENYTINSGKQSPEEVKSAENVDRERSKSAENIDILIKCVQKNMSNKKFDYGAFADVIAKLTKDEQLKNPKLTPHKAQTKVLLDALAATIQELMENRNSCTDKSDYSESEGASNLAKSNLPNTFPEKANIIPSEQSYPSTIIAFNSTQPNLLTNPIVQPSVGQTAQGNSAIPQNNFNSYSTSQTTGFSYPIWQGNTRSESVVEFDNRPLQQQDQNNLQNKQSNLEQPNILNYYPNGQGTGNFPQIPQGNIIPQPVIGFDNRPLEQTNREVQQTNQGNLVQQNMWRSDYQTFQNRPLPPMNNLANQQTAPQFTNGIVIPNTMVLGYQPNGAIELQRVPSIQNFIETRNQDVTNSILTKNSNTNAMYENDNAFTQYNLQQNRGLAIPYGQGNIYSENQQLNNGNQAPQSIQSPLITNNFPNQQFPFQSLPVGPAIVNIPGQQSSSGLTNGFSSFQTQTLRPTTDNVIQSNLLLGNQGNRNLEGIPNNGNFIDTRNQANSSPISPVNLYQNVVPQNNNRVTPSNTQNLGFALPNGQQNVGFIG